MAEENKDQPQNPEPPKFKLGDAGQQFTDKLPTASQALPPKVKLDTSQIKHVTPPGVPGVEPRKDVTLRLNLPGSDSTETAPTIARKKTSRIDIPPAVTPVNKTTARIELPETVIAQPYPKKETKKVQLPDTVVEIPAPTMLKKQTAPMMAAKKQTARVELDMAALTTPASQDAKKTTARIELGDAIGIGKPAAEPVAPGSRQIPRTVRIKQPEMPPTISLKKPPMPVPTGTPTPAGEVRKSETARIELPPETIVEQPVTRRKTIRIKRPGAEGDEVPATRGPMLVSREAGEAVTTTPMPVLIEETTEEEADEPGVLFAICAIAALLIFSVLVYVLAAQTFAPSLPMWGRVV